MSPAPSTGSYGTTRARRASVSYPELERAATAILKSGQRPTIEGLREALKGGSPQTLQSLLNRYWQDLGSRIDASAPALSRIPSSVADIAEELWVRALTQAGDLLGKDDDAARQRFDQIQRDLDTRALALRLREKEIDAQIHSREQTIRELETHLRTTMGFVSESREKIQALEIRAASAESEAASHRSRLATLVRRSTRTARGPDKIRRKRSVPRSKSSTTRREPVRAPVRRKSKTARSKRR